MSELKPCICGQVPAQLFIGMRGIFGNCCDYSIEIPGDYQDVPDDQFWRLINNVWNERQGALESSVKPIKERVECLAEYWSTYDRQHGYENYSEDTFLDDALYGIGVAMSRDFEWAQGYDLFKKKLLGFLTNTRSGGDYNKHRLGVRGE